MLLYRTRSFVRKLTPEYLCNVKMASRMLITYMYNVCKHCEKTFYQRITARVLVKHLIILLNISTNKKCAMTMVLVLFNMRGTISPLLTFSSFFLMFNFVLCYVIVLTMLLCWNKN